MEQDPVLHMKNKTKDPLDSSWKKHMPEGEWVPDISVLSCMVCKGEFSFWNRKHHCRRCGAVVCDPCSYNRTKHIYRDLSRVCEENSRVCDLCIQVIDEKIAVGLNQRFGTNENNPDSGEEGTTEYNSNAYFTPQKNERNGRAVMTMGRYRAEIKESEGNRYIRDNDL